MAFLGSNTSYMNSSMNSYSGSMGFNSMNPVFGGGYGGMMNQQ
jgi:hypothetical protein